MSELKPCPFCGGDAEVSDYGTIFSVGCNACGSMVFGDRATEPESEEECNSIDWDHYRNTAIDKWNNRPNENKIKAEAVRDTVKYLESNEEYTYGFERSCMLRYANKLEKGEV